MDTVSDLAAQIHARNVRYVRSLDLSMSQNKSEYVGVAVYCYFYA